MSGLEDGYALGLDLGTTFSCIGVFRNGGVEIIPNSIGEKVTPSIVTFLDEKNILKGEEAEEYLVKNYESSIYATKRFIGRNFKDKKQNLQKEIKEQNFPFSIVNKNDIPKVEIVKNNKKHYFSLEQISSFIIKKMVQSAEEYLNKKVKKLVISIPHNFSEEQRNSTIEAAKLAGIEVLRTIHEPTAAALAYGLLEKNNLKNNQKILVFDLGGGTFDVTILNIVKDENNNQNFDIISTGSNKLLGGEDFDNKLVEYVLDNFCDKIEDSPEKKEETKTKIKSQKKLIKRLKLSCENIKRVLSIEKDTTLCINNFYDNKDIVQNIDRSTFEEICEDLFKKIEEPIQDALNAKNIKEEEIGEIVLVGGSTRIPKIKSILKKKFKCKINDSINPDETIAYGATLMAAKLSIKKNNLLLGFNLMDITPLSLGVEVINEDKDEESRKEGGIMSVIIERGEKIPCTKERNYITVEDNQTSVPIVIYEGQKKYVKYNHELRKIELTGLTPKPKGKVHIIVKFFLDTNGILTVTGTEKEKDKNNSIEIKIKDDRIKFNDEEIEKLKKENESLYKKRKADDKTIDYNNIKETLKEFQDAYKEEENEDEKFGILINYNNTLEKFINLFDKNFDNETMIEKFYIYVKELFISYEKTLNMKEQIDQEENKSIKDKIMKKIKEYIDEIIMKNSGYLNQLVEAIKTIPKELFYEIIIYIMEKYNTCVGVIIYFLYFKVFPYKGITELALMNCIKKLGKKCIKKTNNKDLDDLIDKLLEQDPKKRISWEDYFKHPFFKKNNEDYSENKKDNEKIISTGVNEEINNLKKLLQNEKNKNDELMKKINKLENELKEEKDKYKKLEEKTNKLKLDLDNAINNYKSNNSQGLDNKLNNYDSKESLYKLILEKDEKIKVLEIKLKRFPFELNEGEELITVNFSSTDQKVQNYSVICKNTDIFNMIEKKLYEDFKDYYDTENYFTFKGKKVHKLRSLKENGIKNNDVIIINIYDL